MARQRGYWTIAAGEHLMLICRKFAPDDREARQLAKEIAALNPNAFILGDPAKLVVGAKLRLPDRLIEAGVAAPAIAVVPASAQPAESNAAKAMPLPAAGIAGSRVEQARQRGYWEVRSGEYLLMISRQFAPDEARALRLAKELAALNPDAFVRRDSSQLVVGARLRLPPSLAASGETKPSAGALTTPAAAEKPGDAAGAAMSAQTQVPATVLTPAPAPALASATSPSPQSASLSVPAAPAAAITSSEPPAPVASAAKADRALPLEVTLNGAKAGVWLLVERDGALHAPKDAFDEWRLPFKPEARPITFRGEPYWPLSAVPGYKARIDFPNQSIELAFSPEAFTAQRLSASPAKRPVASAVLPSAFANFDVNYVGSDFRGASRLHDLGAIGEVGVSHSWGVLTSSYSARNLTGESALGDPRSVLRLETTFTRDFPDRNHTLRLGDANTRAGLWGRNVYFGGIQYGTNFDLTPGFVSQPIPVLRGLSAAPSTVELFVNDVLRQVSNVPTGPFALDNFPAMTGSGETRLVVRDILGRETVIVQSFFEINRLLSQGLNDWSVEAGSVRLDLGTSSNRYGDEFVAGTWRRGITNELTLEGRAELTRKLRVAGVGATVALPAQFLGSATVAASDADRLGNGVHWLVGLERDVLRNSFAIQVEGSSSRFRQLGQDVGLLPNKLQVAGNWTYFTEGWGSLGLGFATISRFSDITVSTVSGNYSLNIGRQSSLSLNVSHAVAGASGTSVGMSFIVPLDNNRSITGASNSRSGQHDFYVAASKTSGMESGLGWRALAGRQQDESRVESGLYYQGRSGTLSGEVSASPERKTVRLGTSGGLVFADGHLFSTRRVDQAFAVAEVAGYPDVGIGLGGVVLSRTNKDGLALVPNLWPYQDNPIRIDVNELPMSAEIDSVEQTAVPAWRSGVKVTFPVRSGRGALIKIVLESGEVAPAGAIVRIDGDKNEFYVARRGEAFVTGLQPVNRLVLTWTGGQCAFDVVLPPEKPDEIARVGPLTCKVTKP